MRRKTLLLLAMGVGGLCLAQNLIRRSRRIEFAGRTVMVTGGARGLGLIMARQLVDQGANVAICSRTEDELRTAKEELEQRGGSVLAFVCDVCNSDEIQSFVQATLERFGRIDVLINNAGVIQVGPVEVMRIEDYEEAMNIHYWGPLHLTLAVLPHMKERGEGRIVNVSSIGGKISVPHLVPYCASKFALTGLSEGLRAELSRHNILLTTVCPHLMRTGSPPNAFFKGRHRAEYAWFSISGSFPIISMSADRAAREILSACQNGDAEIILSFQANLATRLHSLFPNISAAFMSLVARLLPGPVGSGIARFRGKQSYSWISPSVLTALGDEAGVRNNERP